MLRVLSVFLRSLRGRVFVILIFVSGIAFFVWFSQQSVLATHLANAIGVVSAVFAFIASSLNLWNNNQFITLKIQNSETNVFYELPMKIIRHQISRTEILTLLGMIPLLGVGSEYGKRYKISYLSTIPFLEEIREVQDMKKDVLVIPCSDQEFQQFDFANFH